MSRATDNAFPVPGLQTDPDFNGLSVREHFAAMAMQGMLSSDTNAPSVTYVKQQLGMLEHEVYIPSRDFPLYVAKQSVTHADALIAELAK